MPEFDLIRRLQERIAGAASAAIDNSIVGAASAAIDKGSAGPASATTDNSIVGAASAAIAKTHNFPLTCIVDIGDDAAVLEPPPGKQLVICTDTLVESVHFPAETPPRAVGHKALAVNLSDLAAMGAEPAWFFLALTLPRADAAWLDEFAGGMGALAGQASIRLAGGDTTSGPLNICVTVVGLIDPGQALTRGGARAGDLIVVSGVPGRAALALAVLESGGDPDAEGRRALEYPVPRLGLGRALSRLKPLPQGSDLSGLKPLPQGSDLSGLKPLPRRGLASSCIDISDGLLADLGHILEQSGTGAEIDLAALPSSAALDALPAGRRWPLQLAGGDDYELLFTVPAALAHRLDEVSAATDVPLTVIGRISETPGILVREPGGTVYQPPAQGYEHFSAEPADGGEDR